MIQTIPNDFISQLCAAFGGAGIRPGKGYRRKNAPKSRVVTDKRGNRKDLARLTTREVYSMVIGVWRHSQRDGFSQRDGEILAELEDRAYRAHNLQNGRDIPIPNALRVPRLKAKAREILSWIVEATRRGALGCLLSYEEGMAQLGCSRDTWWRWTKKLREEGWIVVASTWRPSQRIHKDEDGRRRLAARDRGRNLYVPGPTLVEALGGEKCLHYAPGEDGADARAHRKAKAAARAERAEKQDRDWRTHNEDPEQGGTAPPRAPTPPAPKASSGGAADSGGRSRSGRAGSTRGERKPTRTHQSENRFAFPGSPEINSSERARSAADGSAPRVEPARPERERPPESAAPPDDAGRRPQAGAKTAPTEGDPPPPPGRRIVTGDATARAVASVTDDGLRGLAQSMWAAMRGKT